MDLLFAPSIALLSSAGLCPDCLYRELSAFLAGRARHLPKAAWFGHAHHRLLCKTKPQRVRRPIQKPAPPATHGRIHQILKKWCMLSTWAERTLRLKIGRA